MVRNAIACGNPVFPYASSIFGLSHWGSWWQFDRFAKGHSFSGTMIERFRLLAMTSRVEPGSVSEHRGMMHAQWGIFFPLTGVAVLTALIRRSRLVLLVALGLALQIAAWLFTTHLQSRFLIPLVVPAAMLVGSAAASIQQRGAGWRSLAALIAFAAIALQSGSTAWIFSREQRGRPNALLVPGPGILSGEPWAQQLDSLSPDELQNTLRHASPEVWINLSLPRDAVIVTASPTAALEVRGEVRYGTLGQYRPAACEEPLRMIRGKVRADGVLLLGAGWTATNDSLGEYTITFTTPFTGAPVVTANQDQPSLTGQATGFVAVTNVTTTSAHVRLFTTSALNNQNFYFIAIGPR